MLLPIAIAVLGTAAASAAQRSGTISSSRGHLEDRLTGSDRWYHVPQASRLPAILQDGMRSDYGICGSGVYLFDELRFTMEQLDQFDEGEELIVLSIACSSEDETRIEPCDLSMVESEGDTDYYEHVHLYHAQPGELWRPSSVEIAWRGWVDEA